MPARKRALRIIQAEPDEAEEEVDIKAWMDEVQLESGNSSVPELVIDMVLSEGAKELGQRLIQTWIEDDEIWTDEKLEALLKA